MTYYIIDGQTIINAVEASSYERAETAMRSMTNGDRLRLDSCPSMAMLQNYRYWHERP